MRKVLLLGNPNVGKSTLFNSLTKSNEHTGNFHGVTVEEKPKVVKFNNEEIEFVDLPGIYSLNTFSYEEEVSRRAVVENLNEVIVLVDANTLRRNLYLCLQLDELQIDYKILINNYDLFAKNGNRIDTNKLSNLLGHEVKIINAKTVRLDNEIFSFLKNNNKNHKNIEKNTRFSINFTKNYIVNNNNSSFPKYLQPIFRDIIKIFPNIKSAVKVLNGENFTSQENDEIRDLKVRAIELRYSYLDKLLGECVFVNTKYVYGESKIDKVLLNPIVMIVFFAALFLSSIYLIFFAIGPKISDGLIFITEKILIDPVMNFLYMSIDNVWILEFMSNGVFSSFTTVLSFLPQVVLLFVFLSILEDSGLISRIAYVFDDFLSKLGLNGKSVYIILMGLGCNTMSAMASRTMDKKNQRIKTAILNPYISCIARLPVFVLIATAFFSQYSFWIIAGLYLLGIIVSLILAFILNKTILLTENSSLLLEFPPIRKIDFKHLSKVALENSKDFVKRVFCVVLTVGVIVWCLSHTTFTLSYTGSITDSVLYAIAGKVSVLFAPIGLNNAGIVSALFVGIMAKELLLSIMSISNNTLTRSALIASLTSVTSVIYFSKASAVSFLIFALLYAPCASTIAVLRKEVGRFYTWFAVLTQLTIAYLLSFVAYQCLTRGVFVGLMGLAIIVLIAFSIFFIAKKIKTKKIGCMFCNKCR